MIPHRPALYLPVGLPGSGKSTIGHLLSRAGFIPKSAIISPDDFRELLTGKRSDQSANGLVFEMCHTVTCNRLYRKQSVYFDATNLTEHARNPLIGMANANDVRIVSILFDTELETVRQQNACSDRVASGSVVPDDVMHTMVGQFSLITAEDLPGEVLSANDIEFVCRSKLLW